MPVVDDLPISLDHSPLGNIQSVSRRGIGAVSILAFLIGMFVQLSMPLTDLYEVPNVRGVFFGLILGICAFRFLSGESFRAGGTLLISYLILSLVLAVGIIYSRAPIYGTTKAILACSYFWLLGTVIYNLVNDLAIGKAFLAGLFIGGLMLIGIVAIEFGNPIELFRNTNRFFRLRFGEDGNPIMLGRHLALAITIIVTYVAVRRRWIDLVWSIPLGLLAFVYLVATGSKGPLLALLFSFVMTPLLMLRGGARMSLTVLVMGVSLLTVLGALEFLPKEFIEERFTEKVQNLSLRMPAYQDVVRALLESDAIQMLVGHGTGDYGYGSLGHDERAYPHNVLLEVAYENGLIGVSLLLAALGYPLAAVMRGTQQTLEYRHRMLLAGLTASYIAAVINAQFSGDLGANLFIGTFGAALTGLARVQTWGSD